MAYHELTEKDLQEFKAVCDMEGIKYDTDAEYREAAQNLYNFASLSLDMAREEEGRKRRLQSDPGGFYMSGEGRNCSLCRQSVYGTDGWYDKWGFKCINCQDAVNKKKIPGSLCGDWDNNKCITDSSLAWKSGIHIQTVRKLIRNGKIRARQIPKGPYIILLKDNPGLADILVEHKINI